MSNQDSFLHMRISSADKALLVKAANGGKLTDFVINASLEKARKIMFDNMTIEQATEILESNVADEIMNGFEVVKTEKQKIEKRVFSMRHAIETIDDYIRQFGYTVTAERYTKEEMTLSKESGKAWIFDGKLNKRELVEFANNL
jgi:uncharacterized protein (DUF1778 family)